MAIDPKRPSAGGTIGQGAGGRGPGRTSANQSLKRYCRNPSCGKPLGSTEHLCHDCGGRSYRGVRDRTTIPPILPGVTAALGQMFQRRGRA